MAFFLEMAVQAICRLALPAATYLEETEDEPGMQMILFSEPDTLIYMVLSGLTAGFLLLCLQMRMASVIRSYRSNNRMPDALGIRMEKEEWRIMPKAIYICLTGFAALLAGGGIIGAIALKTSVWVNLLLLPWALFVGSAGFIALTRATVLDESWGRSMKYGMRHAYGVALIIQLLMGFFTGVMACIFETLPCIYTASCMASSQSLMMGYTETLPQYLTILFFVLNTLGFSLACLTKSLRDWALAMKVCQ